MRILIIGTGKCGSGTLMYALAEDLKYDVLVEPFNRAVTDNFNFIIEDNTIVKIINTVPSDDIIEFSEQFDKVILIDRRDEVERFFSIMHAHQHDTWTHKENYSPQDVIINRDWIPYLRGVFEGKECINRLSKDMDIPIVSMEDLCTADYNLSKETYQNIIDTGNDFQSLYDTHFDIKHKQQLKIPK